MKKIIINLFLFLFLLFITLIFVLSTIGIETDKFNNLISDKVNKKRNVSLELDTIKFKLDFKELRLFLETQNPKINYRAISIPSQNIKVYIDFLSLFKSETKINKISVILKELDIVQLNKLSNIIKPSNFKTLLNNKVKEGRLISEIEIFFNKEGKLKNFIAKGDVKNLKAELVSSINLKETNLSFFADKNDILIKNIFGYIEDIKITDGDIKLNLEKGVNLNSNFNSIIDLDHPAFKKYSKFLESLGFTNKIKKLKGNFSNNFYINLDNTYKVKDYNYSISGKIEKSNIELLNPIKNNFIIQEIKQIYLSNFLINTIFTPKNIKVNGDGKYSINDKDYLKIDFENNFNEGLINSKINFDYKNNFQLDIINYKKPVNSTANFSLDLEKKKKLIKINKFNYSELNNFIKINDLTFKENKFLSFKKIQVLTKNNDFFIQNKKKIFIKGTKFDASNLAKNLRNQGEENKFKKISSNIEIDFKNILVPMSKELKNFKLIGEIERGQFVKISSKGDFGENNFLDISMKKDINTGKKHLEIYSDLTRPLLAEYSFFNGLSGGKLLFTSVIDVSKSNSKLKIENFKVVNAPGVIKLLSLADLGGLADLAEGEGLSFDVLEIDMEKNKKFLKLNEILALGPSISVLMEGYQDENGLTSLRGTLVPAKTLNKIISKIPVIGNIVIPKDVGEGLFGISFKMKGPKGKIKTTINPIRTLTPRFIQKIIDKKKKTK